MFIFKQMCVWFTFTKHQLEFSMKLIKSYCFSSLKLPALRLLFPCLSIESKVPGKILVLSNNSLQCKLFLIKVSFYLNLQYRFRWIVRHLLTIASTAVTTLSLDWYQLIILPLFEYESWKEFNYNHWPNDWQRSLFRESKTGSTT